MSDEWLRLFASLPHLLGWHLIISMLSLGLGVTISLPLAIGATRLRSLRWPVLAAASIIQTIPALALLALMVAVLIGVNAVWLALAGRPGGESPLPAIGFLPTIIALTLYSILPILRNTVTGILGVDGDLLEAADGVGLTGGQRLRLIELPLAAPIILAGIRTATVWTVGMATLSTPVGQSSLGDYIFQGLQTRNWLAVAFGCVAAAGLAIVLDQLLGLLESGAKQRRPRRVRWAGGLLVLVVLAGLTPITVRAVQARMDDRPSVTIGVKPFPESFILADLIADTVRGPYAPTQKRGLGSAVAFEALRVGAIDAYVGYTGTVWTTIMKRDTLPEARTMRRKMASWLKREHGIRCLGPLGFENAYALAVRRAFARKYDLQTVADLARIAPRVTLASDPEFFGRPEWRHLQKAYGLDFAATRSMQAPLMYQAIAAREVDVITAYTSDGRIRAYDLVILKDPKQVLPPYEAVLLLSPQAAKRPRLEARLRPLIGEINLDRMRHANMLVTEKGRPVEEAADWLRQAITTKAGP